MERKRILGTSTQPFLAEWDADTDSVVLYWYVDRRCLFLSSVWSTLYLCHHIYSADWASTGMVANLARGELNMENQNLIPLDGFPRPVSRQRVLRHTQAKSTAVVVHEYCTTVLYFCRRHL